MTPTRIRWDDKTPGNGDVYNVASIGYAGTVEEAAFIIYTPDTMHADWLLSVRLIPGSTFLYADTPGELKAEAERWLEEFVGSLGAIFFEPAKGAEMANATWPWPSPRSYSAGQSPAPSTGKEE